jgi:hypothetical protein
LLQIGPHFSGRKISICGQTNLFNPDPVHLVTLIIDGWQRSCVSDFILFNRIGISIPTFVLQLFLGFRD